MSEQQKTHRLVKFPQMSARSLADYMAASERARRTIVRSCKYQSLARIVQHDEAKQAAAKHIRHGGSDLGDLTALSAALRDRMADSDFDRDLFDHNADYLDRFAQVSAKIVLPDADRLAPGKALPITRNGVKITVEIHLRLRRLTRTTKCGSERQC